MALFFSPPRLASAEQVWMDFVAKIKIQRGARIRLERGSRARRDSPLQRTAALLCSSWKGLARGVGARRRPRAHTYHIERHFAFPAAAAVQGPSRVTAEAPEVSKSPPQRTRVFSQSLRSASLESRARKRTSCLLTAAGRTQLGVGSGSCRRGCWRSFCRPPLASRLRTLPLRAPPTAHLYLPGSLTPSENERKGFGGDAFIRNGGGGSFPLPSVSRSRLDYCISFSVEGHWPRRQQTNITWVDLSRDGFEPRSLAKVGASEGASEDSVQFRTLLGPT